MIIIEGTDCVGKTTLAKKIEAETGLLYRHLSRLPDGFNHYHDYLPLMHHNFVCDRLWLSDLAYRKAENKQCDITPFIRSMLIAQQTLIGTIQVVITCDQQLLAKRWNSNQMYDLRTTSAANGAFRLYAMSPRSYSVDLHIHLTEENPWPDESETINLHKQLKQQLKSIS